MNWPAMLIFMLVFYGAMGYSYNLIGEASSEDVVPIRDVYTVSFENINEEWFSGEYHISDEYDFKKVNAPQNLSEGQRVTISGEIEVGMDFDFEYMKHKLLYKLRIKLWDATRGIEQAVITKSVPFSILDKPKVSFRFDGGEMPANNYYYVIELYVKNDYTGMEWLKEKWGGVIEGDEGKPIGVHYRERSEQVDSGGLVNEILKFFRNAWGGFEMINDSPIGKIVNIVVFSPLIAVSTFMLIVLPARIIWGK